MPTVRTRLVSLLLITCIGLAVFGGVACSVLGSKPTLRLGASIYVGWMPWFLANDDGTLRRNAESEGLQVAFVQGDYIETVNQYAAGGLDAVVVTNVDALALLVGANVPTDIILIGSFSHGNDAILMRPGRADDLTGQTLGLVELSVSHYLLDRYLEQKGMPFGTVKVINVSDSEMAGAFVAPGTAIDGVVTWNPIALQIEQTLNGRRLFDSRNLEREIADMLVVRRSTIEKHPRFTQALLKTWFEITGRMSGRGQAETLEQLGKLSGADRAAYEEQLQTTLLIDTPQSALDTLQDARLQQAMQHAQAFVQRHNMVTNAPPGPWVSFPGDGNKGILHFANQSLMTFVGSSR